MSPRIRAFLAVGRMANLPTVWANVIAACWLGGIDDLTTVLLHALGGSLLYVGGAALNDVCDAAFDRAHRPERAIPAGLFGYRAIFIFAASSLLAGAAILLIRGNPIYAIALLVAIVAYDLLHKKTRFGIVLMAACRTGLYLAAGTPAGAGPLPAVLVCGTAVGLYIVALSVFARKESTGTPPPRWVLLLLLCPLLARPESAATPGWVVSAALFTAWLIYACAPLIRRTEGIGSAVGKWLAGLVLIDLHFVAPTAPIGLWAVLMALFLLARGLQTLAPAT